MVNQITLNAYSYKGLSSGGKLAVPVNPSAVIYTQLDHIQGVAARSNQNGISVSKIRILNTLIDQLVSMKNTPKVSAQDTPLNDKQMDALIKNYQSQIQTAVNAAKTSGYGLSGTAPQTGALFSLDV